MKLRILPLTKDNWNDFEKLFGPRGACEGCWCMSWRLHAAEYKKMKGEKNKMAMKKLVKKSSPGLLAYLVKEPVGWCAVAPRQEYPRFENSRVLQPVDEQPVWSVSCFFINKKFRNQGLSLHLLRAAVKKAFDSGATIVEGYPVEPRKNKMADVFVWTGLASVFKKAGFSEVARRSETRPIMRFEKKQE